MRESVKLIMTGDRELVRISSTCKRRKKQIEGLFLFRLYVAGDNTQRH